MTGLCSDYSIFNLKKRLDFSHCFCLVLHYHNVRLKLCVSVPYFILPYFWEQAAVENVTHCKGSPWRQNAFKILACTSGCILTWQHSTCSIDWPFGGFSQQQQKSLHKTQNSMWLDQTFISWKQFQIWIYGYSHVLQIEKTYFTLFLNAVHTTTVHTIFHTWSGPFNSQFLTDWTTTIPRFWQSNCFHCLKISEPHKTYVALKFIGNW